jgi:hypothetical protein
MPTHEGALIAEARRVTRLQAKLTRLRREQRSVQAELRQARKNLRALAQSKADPFDQAPPIKGFGE